MRVIVTGATGNVGTAVVAALLGDPKVDHVVGVARRRPTDGSRDVEWRAADVAHDDLRPVLEGADAVVHLAWLIQPARDPAKLRRVNVEGSRRVFAAAEQAGARIVHASSVGAYSVGPKDVAVDETWPTGGIPSSVYSRDKAAVERELDSLEAGRPGVRVVRLRPGLIFQAAAAEEIRRFFAGPLLPARLVRPAWIPVVPDMDRLAVQAVHAADVADAFRLAATHPDASGAYNVAAEPVLDPPTLADALGARRVRVPARLVRELMSLSWRAHLQPTEPGWLDLALGTPLMATGRIRRELGWAPRHTADATLRELLTAMADRRGGSTPPLEASD